MVVLSKEYNIHYRAWVVSLIYLLSTRVDLCIAVHKLEKFSSNPGKVHFEGLVHLLRYIRDNNSCGLIYHSNIEDATISDLLMQASINTDYQLMVFYYSRWKGFPDTGRSIGENIFFFHGVPVDHFTHVPGPVAKSSS